MDHLTTPYHKNACSMGHEIYSFGRALPGYHYYILSISDLCPGVENNIFKEMMHGRILSQEPLSQGI